MPRGYFPVRRWLVTVIALLVATLACVPTIAADEPGSPWGTIAAASHRDLDGWQSKAAGQARPAADCWHLTFSDIEASRLQLILTDVDMLAGGDGTRACVFQDARWNSYGVILLNQQSIGEFRRTKAQLQPLIVNAGVDPCQIAFWTTPATAVQQQMTLHDRNDAARYCVPEVISHGPSSERRVAEVRASTDASVLAAESALGWLFTWPVRVHLYDSHEDFVNGKRIEGGDDQTNGESLEFSYGLTTLLDNGMVGILIDTSRFPEPIDLRMLLAHEVAHVAQAGLLGDTGTLPFFVHEGGAEYIASLVVGGDQRDLADRLHTALVNELRGEAIPLRDLIARPGSSDLALASAAYSRGYAAMLFLTERWGLDSFTRLHQENVGGTPELFIQNLARVTAMSLDEFERELRAWLRGQVLV
ncbi:MAG: hypothetical protein AB7R89_02250 [Dehalococcoidia bacterium]